MKSKWMIGLMAGCLIFGAASGIAQEISFKDTRIKAFEFHRSLIGYAVTGVRAKITASAQAAKDYVTNCGQKCDFNLFLSNDLKKRFHGLEDKPLHLLMAMVFAEAVEDNSYVENPQVREALAQATRLIVNISKMQHEMAKGIIQNIRA